jgi:serine/threonine-protein kinase
MDRAARTSATTAERSVVEVRAGALQPGERVDRFRVCRWLGTGGHGVVYAAEHAELGYPVAIKVLEPSATRDPRRRARFRREATLGARVRHRNVVAILDSGELPDGSLYLVMEHVDGIELAQLLAEEGPLTPAAAIELGIDLLSAIDALWQHGMIHRDIKPQNVMLSRAVDGSVEAKLLDLGIVKALGQDPSSTLTQEGFVLGTPHYMSPEQVTDRTLDVRSDLYAIGALLYEAISGDPPFDSAHTEGVMTKILVEDPEPLDVRCPDCPRALADVIERALAKRRDDRHRSPAAMAEALRAVSEGLRLPRGAAAWKELEPAFGRGRERAPQGPTRSGPLLAQPRRRTEPSPPAPTSARCAALLRPTPPERPSALRARPRRPRFPPPWWSAVGFAVVLSTLLLGSYRLHTDATTRARDVGAARDATPPHDPHTTSTARSEEPAAPRREISSRSSASMQQDRHTINW